MSGRNWSKAHASKRLATKVATSEWRKLPSAPTLRPGQTFLEPNPARRRGVVCVPGQPIRTGGA